MYLMSNIAIVDDKPKRVSKPRGLNLNQKAFLKYYTDIDSPTFGNKRGSYIKAYPESSTDAAGVSAIRLLKNDTIQESLQETLHTIDYTDNIRVSEIKDLAKGIPNKSLTIHRDTEGNVQGSTETISTPKPRDMLAAHKVINDMTGIKEKNKVVATTKSKVITALVKDMMSERKKDKG